jgi:cobalt/nickel transport system permease protein
MKLLSALLLIVAISVTRNHRYAVFAAYVGILIIGILLARLPLMAVALRAAIILPFSLTLSFVSWLGGDLPRALAIPVKSYLSCLTAVLLISTTAVPSVLRALDWFRVPRTVLFVTQFVYRYLFVIFDEASAMRHAANCRGGALTRGRPVFQAAAGTLAVLFSKSYKRADGVHNAMIARGFNGSINVLQQPVLSASDVSAFILVGVSVVVSWMML